jgi:hypothetical protein
MIGGERIIRSVPILGIAMTMALCGVRLGAAQEKQPAAPSTQPASGADAKADGSKLVPLELKLPRPAFKGTPTNIPAGTNLEAPRKGPRPPLPVPPGVKNVALNKSVTSSDSDPIIGSLKLVTDGDKDAKEGSYVELGPRRQYVQIDLKAKAAIYAIVVWHYHASARVYHNVVIQVADDADFVGDVHTVFNNDHDNSAGLGLGHDKEYWETYEGKLIDTQGVVGRYVRLYSKGSTADDQNHYTEVEVYGLPAK